MGRTLGQERDARDENSGGERPGSADLIVVDKPIGVAAHPTPGWTGPTVRDGLIAAGYTVATSGAARERTA